MRKIDIFIIVFFLFGLLGIMYLGTVRLSGHFSIVLFCNEQGYKYGEIEHDSYYGNSVLCERTVPITRCTADESFCTNTFKIESKRFSLKEATK